jgi:esterase/lipase superfamily enzyme
MFDSDQILLALLDVSDELARLLSDTAGTLYKTMMELLLRFELDGDDAVRDEVDALVDKLLDSPAAGTISKLPVFFPLDQQSSDPKRGAGGASGVSYVEIPVYFATNRAEQPGAGVEKRFGADRGALSFGVAQVSIPHDHELGKVETPRWWRLEFRPNPDRHVVLHAIEVLDRARYVDAFKDAVASADSRDALVYVHGYNVRFADAARRAAQIAHDLKFPGRTALFSWPSQGGTQGYIADGATVEWATPDFETFLRIMLAEVGARTVHVLAHSMGNRALARALSTLDPALLPQGAAQLHQVIFAAPDVDRSTFLQLASAFRKPARRITLYASSGDVALRASRFLHAGPRAGNAGPDIVVAQGIDTIDASAVDTSLFGLGHSYYAGKRSILNDIFHLLKAGDPPDQRFDMKPVDGPPKHWCYRP